MCFCIFYLTSRPQLLRPLRLMDFPHDWSKLKNCEQFPPSMPHHLTCFTPHTVCQLMPCYSHQKHPKYICKCNSSLLQLLSMCEVPRAILNIISCHPANRISAAFILRCYCQILYKVWHKQILDQAKMRGTTTSYHVTPSVIL